MNYKQPFKFFSNAVQVRLNNRRITVIESKEDSYVIQFQNCTTDAENPAVKHEVLRGRIRQTHIALSDEAMDAIVKCYRIHKARK